MSETRKEILIRLWRLLKQPFVLPCNYTHTHACEWKAIDVDILGCILCGEIHACADLTCKDIIETDDGTVCALSGVYIRNKQYVVSEFQDTVNLTDMKVSHRILDESSYEDVTSIFESLILSPAAEQMHYKQQLSYVLKYHQLFKKKQENSVVLCVKIIQHIREHMHTFDHVVRKKLVCKVVQHCWCVLSVLMSEFGMYVKANELQEMAVGLLYLMRTGIRHTHIVILPAVPELTHILPPENLLNSCFGIRAKYITESENRTKLCLRRASPEKLSRIVFGNFSTDNDHT